MIVSAPISVGELIDKITILKIKRERILSPAKLKNIEQELQLLEEIRTSSGVPSLEAEEEQLYLVNNELWDIENYKRACEQDRRFDFLFIEAARNVYLKNDRRAEIKREINLLTGSTIQEEKSY